MKGPIYQEIIINNHGFSVEVFSATKEGIDDFYYSRMFGVYQTRDGSGETGDGSGLQVNDETRRERIEKFCDAVAAAVATLNKEAVK